MTPEAEAALGGMERFSEEKDRVLCSKTHVMIDWGFGQVFDLNKDKLKDDRIN